MEGMRSGFEGLGLGALEAEGEEPAAAPLGCTAGEILTRRCTT